MRGEERGIVGGTKRPSVYEHRKTMNSVTAWPPVPWRAEPRPFPFCPFFLSNFFPNVPVFPIFLSLDTRTVSAKRDTEFCGLPGVRLPLRLYKKYHRDNIDRNAKIISIGNNLHFSPRFLCIKKYHRDNINHNAKIISIGNNLNFSLRFLVLSMLLQ